MNRMKYLPRLLYGTRLTKVRGVFGPEELGILLTTAAHAGVSHLEMSSLKVSFGNARNLPYISNVDQNMENVESHITTSDDYIESARIDRESLEVVEDPEAFEDHVSDLYLNPSSNS